MHGLHPRPATSPLPHLSIVRHIIVAVQPAIFLAPLGKLIAEMLQPYARRGIVIENEDLRTNDLQPPDRGVVAHPQIPGPMYRNTGKRLDLADALLESHRSHFQTVIGAENRCIERTQILLLVLGAPNILAV